MIRKVLNSAGKDLETNELLTLSTKGGKDSSLPKYAAFALKVCEAPRRLQFKYSVYTMPGRNYWKLVVSIHCKNKFALFLLRCLN